MRHLPFENWIFDREKLTPSQIAELEAHLQTCPQCKHIQTGWKEVESLLHTPPFTPAPPQFANRFQASLAERKAKRQKQQVRIALFTLGGAFIFASMVFILRLFWTVAPARLLSDIIGWITLAPQRWSEIQYIFYYWGSQIPPLALVALVFLLAGWSILLLTLWLLTFQRLSKLGVRGQ
ncbi:MAG: zf-HC2 domain-containing protein [Chloroflexota bacterium]